jgi:glucose/arabinose dehydrogenase
MIRSRATVVLAAMIAMVAVACGGDGGPTSPFTRPSSASSTTAPIPSPTGSVTSSPGPTSQPGPISVTLTPLAPIDGAISMDVRTGDDLLYVASQAGQVYSVASDGGEPQLVLDVTDLTSPGGEQGLLGMAFAPDGDFLYLNYTDTAGDTNVDEFRVVGPEQIDRDSRRNVLFVSQPFANHNGGNLAFGPDGYLYIGLGDGGSGGDPMDNGQSLDTPLGKMLRIDPRPSGDESHAVPPDNPFVGQGDALPEIWAYGLRNPWRYTFDRETGDLWIGDVGQGEIEEIDLQPGDDAGGENYGWNRLEGTQPFQGDPPPDAVPPFFEYDHGNGSCAVVGGYVYRGQAIPALQGSYLFGDNCLQQIGVLDTPELGGAGQQAHDLGVEIDRLSSFGQDADGELYVLSLTDGVFRIDPA